MIMFGMLLFFYCAIMLLTLWKGVAQWRHQVHRSPLIDVFYRGGLWYFVCLFAFSTANFIISYLNIGGGDYTLLLVEMQHVLHSIISARMILNMRGAAARLGLAPSRLTSIRFASRIVNAPSPDGHRCSNNAVEMADVYSFDSHHRTEISEGVVSSGSQSEAAFDQP